MRAKLSLFKWQTRRDTRARVLGQVWDGGNERGDGTRLGERHQRLFLETLRHDNRQTRDSCPRRGARASMGLRRSRSSSSALMTRDMNGDRMEASRAGEGEERGGEDEVAAAPPPPSAGTPAFAPSAAREGATCTAAAPPLPATEAAEEAAANAFKNLTALPVTNPALARCSVVKSPMTSSSISCTGQNN